MRYIWASPEAYCKSLLLYPIENIIGKAQIFLSLSLFIITDVFDIYLMCVCGVHEEIMGKYCYHMNIYENKHF